MAARARSAHKPFMNFVWPPLRIYPQRPSVSRLQPKIDNRQWRPEASGTTQN
jgi:hypothetical protein